MRARWSHLIVDRDQLNTAFSIEAIADEVVFVLGPVLVTFLTLQTVDVLGLAVAATAATTGSFALATQRGTAPPPSPHRTHHEDAGLRWTFLGPIVIVSAALGIVFGSAEVVVAAFTDEQGRPGAAGLVLAIWAVGSLLAGLAVGALPQTANPLARLRWTVLALGVLFVPMCLVDSLAWVAVGMFVCGFMISPSLIATVNLIERHVPATRLTEALTWSTTGVAVGVAPGAALAGSVVESHGGSAGFWVPMIAGLVGALVAWTTRTPT